MKYLTIIIGLIIVIPVFGQRNKKGDEIVVAPTYVEGITYSLPRTGLRGVLWPGKLEHLNLVELVTADHSPLFRSVAAGLASVAR